jgi:hypothetical protein
MLVAAGDRDRRRRRVQITCPPARLLQAGRVSSESTKENQEHSNRGATGNSVSPLDKTYHGGSFLCSPRPQITGIARAISLRRVVS